MRSSLFLASLFVASCASAIIRTVGVNDADYISAGSGIPVAWIQYTGDSSFTVGGVLINDRTLLSAGHCFRSGTHTAKIGGQTYTITNWVPHPSWNFTTPAPLSGFDFSIARLDRRVTNLTPLAVNSSSLPSGTAINIAGVGGTGLGNGTGYAFPWSPIPATWPTRAMTNRADVDGTLPNIFLTDFDNPTGTSNTLSFLGSTAAASAREGNLIWGDSGGPVTRTISGVEQVVGVNSAIGDQSGNGTTGDYGDISIYSRTSVAFSWIMSTAWQAGRVAGKVNLGDFTGSYELRTAAIRLRAPGSGTVLETFDVPLAVDRGFSFVTARRGLTDVHISVPGFCSRLLTNVNITDTAPGNLTVVLPNGDPDLSGEVDAADIDLVIANFGANTTAATSGDMDGSAEVDAADIDIVIANFGATSTP